MQKSLTPKLLPEQVYGREQVKFRLRRQYPWERLAELRAYQAGAEKPAPFVPKVSLVAPVTIEPRTAIDPEMEKRKFAQRARMIEISHSRLEMNRLHRALGQKQSFFNVKHTVD